MAKLKSNVAVIYSRAFFLWVLGVTGGVIKMIRINFSIHFKVRITR